MMTDSLEIDGVVLDLGDEFGASAIFDPSRAYRYQLTRAVSRANAGTVVWVMLNPSTADAFALDPTIRRCMGFTYAWGFGQLIVVNAFALRSTDPRALRTAADPVGPDNDRAIVSSCRDANLVIAAWGVHARLGDRDLAVHSLLRGVGASPHCLRTTKGGDPCHPLYLPASLTPQPWSPAR